MLLRNRYRENVNKYYIKLSLSLLVLFLIKAVNMKFLVIAGVIVAFLAMLGFGETAVGRAALTNPDYPGKCVIDLNTILSHGQSGKAPNHPCAGVVCMENGHVEFRTCPAVAPPKGCKMRDFVNINRSYPDCCERKYDCTRNI